MSEYIYGINYGSGRKVIDDDFGTLDVYERTFVMGNAGDLHYPNILRDTRLVEAGMARRENVWARKTIQQPHYIATEGFKVGSPVRYAVDGFTINAGDYAQGFNAEPIVGVLVKRGRRWAILKTSERGSILDHGVNGCQTIDGTTYALWLDTAHAERGVYVGEAVFGECIKGWMREPAVGPRFRMGPVKAEGIVSGQRTCDHSLAYEVTSMERVAAHWDGFLANKRKAAAEAVA